MANEELKRLADQLKEMNRKLTALERGEHIHTYLPNPLFVSGELRSAGGYVRGISGFITQDGTDYTNGVFRSGIATINDDGVFSFTPIVGTGVMIINTKGGALGVRSAIIQFRTVSVAIGLLVQSGGAAFEVTTGALTGTTGTDDHFTVSTHTDGKIYIENRAGGTVTFSWALLT